MLDVSNIDVYYNSMQVLWGVTLRVGEHERVALIGPNAAGKSTTFKAITGLLRPRAGTIQFQGERIDGLKPDKILRKGVSLSPEGRLLFPEMRVIENLQLGAYIHGGLGHEQDTLEWVYQLFPILKERKDQLGGSLSGGEQQMLAIGRSLMSRPKLLLLDEPSQGLGPIVVSKVFEALEEIRKHGTSILVSEQNVRLALNFCDRGYILENGRVAMGEKACNLISDEHVRQAYLGI